MSVQNLPEKQMDPAFVSEIQQIIRQGRRSAYASVNAAMLMTYWSLGERIVQEEQKGEARAAYGKQLISQLSQILTAEFGEGFSARALRDYRRFYLCFPDSDIWHACVPNLMWTHFRILCRESNSTARLWYMQEAASEGWNTRTLERNISTQYYFRLLQTPDPEKIKQKLRNRRRFTCCSMGRIPKYEHRI